VTATLTEFHPLTESVQPVFDTVLARSPHEPEFQQAVHEVLGTISPALEQHPEYVEAGILDRIVEPERQIMFRVPWIDDAGKIQVNRGYRIQFSSVLGPYKGGSDFDPHGKSDAEVMRFCQSFMGELYRHLGEHTDVPAGDIGVGGREIGYLFGTYRKITNRHESGMFTGKGTGWGGAEVRTEATGYGAVFFAQEMLAVRGDSFEGKRVGVSGSGNVAIYAIQKATQLGATAVTASDSSGYVVDDAGIDLGLLRQIKEVERGRIVEYANRRASARFVEGGSVWDVPVDIAVPSATQNELSLEDAEALIANGVLAVSEGANMPCIPEAVAAFQRAGVLFAPGKAANAGGVATSALEMSQNAARQRWTFGDSENKLREIMRDIHQAAFDAAEKYGVSGDYVAGANIAAFQRVAAAMLAQGVI